MPPLTGQMPEQDLLAEIPETLPEPGEPGPAERGMPPTATRSVWAAGFGEVDGKAMALAVLIRAALKDDRADARKKPPRSGGVWAKGFTTADAASAFEASKPSYARRQRSRRTNSSPKNIHSAGTYNS